MQTIPWKLVAGDFHDLKKVLDKIMKERTEANITRAKYQT